ncbi:LpqB family beta-propeller domain-containing protein [Glycomyces tenuis]|uniref:LpqB family beta-propeller domain-containing protein n=1 Tax=Glycomyces tenuis TaxID=58116 RepID=UPI000426CED9|nr:LpqB family beta-propeller domain-containing protein [Glycomyces tenuis]
MRTRTLACAVVAASCVAAPALVSCGVPSSSAPEALEAAPTDFDQSSSIEVEAFLPTTDATTTVDHFLRAASGDPTGRDERLHEFTDEAREFSDAVDGIGLLDDVQIDLGDGTDDLNATSVTVTGTVIGTYLPDGQVRMNVPPREYEERFALEREEFTDTWSISDPPSQVMMLRDQFEGAYEQAPLYFQATGRNDLLVPDLRWVYRNLDETVDNQLRLRWLVVQGPSDLVSRSARSVIPAGTTPEFSDEDGVIRINLTLGEAAAALDSDTTDAIAAQIVWSLGLSGEFELLIEGEQVAEGTLADWRDWNAIPSGDDEIGYFIAEDTVWQLENGAVTDASADHPWVGFSTPGLEQVDIASDEQIAAVVATESGFELQIGRGEGDMSTVQGLGGTLSDPQWLTEGTVMLIDDGVLTVVDAASGAVEPLAGETVRSLSVAPDGHRIVYVEDGRASVAPLSHDADGNLQFGQSQRLGLDITGVTGVAWASEDFVWIAGARGGSDDKLFRVSIDNAETESQSGTSGLPLAEEIAAKPADPVAPDQNRGEPTVVVIGTDLYRAYSSNLQPIEDSDGQIVQGSAPFTVPE